MNQKEFEKYLSGRYKDQINWYDKKANQNQWWFKALNIYVILTSIVIPVLISALDTSHLVIKILITIVSGTIALAAGVNNLYKFHENWINYRTTCETLKKEKSYYDGGVDAYSSINDKKALFVERVESIISRENTLWLITQKIEKDDKKT